MFEAEVDKVMPVAFPESGNSERFNFGGEECFLEFSESENSRRFNLTTRVPPAGALAKP